jgi:hypothetical protein
LTTKKTNRRRNISTNINHRIDYWAGALQEREDDEMVQPTGGYLRETGSARSFHSVTNKNPRNDSFRRIDTIPANGELPSVRMSALRQAMASADVRLALDNLDETADSFEQRLEAELGKSSNDVDGTERDQQKIERVNVELDKACREIAQEAQINLRISQLMHERDREIRSEPAETRPAGVTIAAQSRKRPFTAASAARRIALLGVLAVILGGGWAARDLPVVQSVMQKIAGTETTPALAATMARDDLRAASPPSTASTATDPNEATEPAAEEWRSSLGDRMSPNTIEATATAPAERTVAPVKIVPPSNALPVIRSNIRPRIGTESVRIVRAVPETNLAPAPLPKAPAETTAALSAKTPSPRLTGPAEETAPRAAEVPLPQSRQLEMVEVALNTARGLDTLNNEQRDVLKQKLVQGECLADALGSVFLRVPILAMRDLVRQLEGAC